MVIGGRHNKSARGKYGVQMDATICPKTRAKTCTNYSKLILLIFTGKQVTKFTIKLIQHLMINYNNSHSRRDVNLLFSCTIVDVFRIPKKEYNKSMFKCKISHPSLKNNQIIYSMKVNVECKSSLV